jgi:hypothetical protein
MSTKEEEITQYMVQTMAEHPVFQGWEDDTEVQIAFLEGLQESWDEDPDRSLEKTLYKLALTGMITSRKARLAIEGVS